MVAEPAFGLAISGPVTVNKSVIATDITFRLVDALAAPATAVPAFYLSGMPAYFPGDSSAILMQKISY